MSPRTFWWVALLAAAIAECQTRVPNTIQGPILPPAITGAGNNVVFGSSFSSSGVPGSAFNVCTVNTDGSGFRQLTNSPSATSYQSVTSVSLTSDGRWAGYTANPSGSHEEVHLLNVLSAPAGGSDRTLYVDTQGCVLPLAICIGCPPYTCLRTPHVSDDGSAVLFAQAGNPAFLVAKSDGSAPTGLPVYSGTLAASGKRVISTNGQVVFTSSAPSGPVSSAAQIYLMNLDGTNLRKVTEFTDTSAYPQEATISADGSLIAFTVPSADGTTTLYTIRSDGYQFSAVAAGAVSSPSLSADGTLLAYIDTGRVVVLTPGPTFTRRVLTSSQNSVAGDATISDDGTRVAFTLGKAPTVYGVITSGPVSNVAESVIYSTAGTGAAAVYSVSTGGGIVQPAYAPRYVDPPSGAGAVAGSLASSYAFNLTADSAVVASTLPLPQSLAGVSLNLNGRAVPLLSLTPWQIEYQIPEDAVPGAAVLQPEFTDGTVSAATSIDVLTVLPTVIPLSIVPTLQAAVFHGNASTPTDSTHPATAGEVLVMYASGMGPTNPMVPAGTGAPANPPALTIDQPQVSIGSKTAQVQFSGLAPGMVGVYQINFVLPSGLGTGQQPVSLIAAGQFVGVSGYIYTK